MGLTWGEAVSQWPQGYRGIYLLRFSAQGKLLDKAPAVLRLLLSIAGLLTGYGSQTVVLAVRTVRIFTLVGFVASSDAAVIRKPEGTLSVTQRIGPAGERTGFDQAIAEGLGLGSGL